MSSLKAYHSSDHPTFNPPRVRQIAETPIPGEYRLWVLLGSNLHSIKLKVPRIFYVNKKTPKEGESHSAYTSSIVVERGNLYYV